MAQLTQLVFHIEDDSYQAIVGDDLIKVARTTFDKAVRSLTKEYMRGGMIEVPDAYVRAKDWLLIADYWISSTMDGVSINGVTSRNAP